MLKDPLERAGLVCRVPAWEVSGRQVREGPQHCEVVCLASCQRKVDSVPKDGN